MKRLLFSVFLFTVCLQMKAQLRYEVRGAELTRTELFRLRTDQLRYNHLQQRVLRDGIITPRERRKLLRMKIHNRREATRFRNNSRQRL